MSLLKLEVYWSNGLDEDDDGPYMLVDSGLRDDERWLRPLDELEGSPLMEYDDVSKLRGSSLMEYDDVSKLRGSSLMEE